MKYTYTTQKEVRRLFWQTFPDLDRRKITDYSGKGKMYKTDTRCAFVDFIDQLRRADEISPELAERITL